MPCRSSAPHVLARESTEMALTLRSRRPFGPRLKDRVAFIDPASVRWLEAFQKLIRWHTTEGADRPREARSRR